MSQHKKKQAAAPAEQSAAPSKKQKGGERDVWFSNYENNAQGNATGNYGDACVPEGYATAQAILDGTTAAEVQASIGTAPNATIYSPVNYVPPISFSACLGGNADFVVPSNSTPEFVTLGPWEGNTNAPNLFVGGMNTSSTGIYTVPASGTYIMTATISWDGNYSGNTSSGSRYAQIVLNRLNHAIGGEVSYVICSSNVIPSATSAFDTVQVLNTSGQFMRGDTLQVQVAQTSGSNLGVTFGIATQWAVHPILQQSVNHANPVSIAH